MLRALAHVGGGVGAPAAEVGQEAERLGHGRLLAVLAVEVRAQVAHQLLAERAERLHLLRTRVLQGLLALALEPWSPALFALSHVFR